MNLSDIAKQLGRKGGLMRAKRLSSIRRKEIAQMGATARKESLRLAKVIQNNFDYVSAINSLRPKKPITSHHKIMGRIPGIYG